jgi:hypothetical protein
MEKKTDLTQDERNELMLFIGECVLSNRSFPSVKLGHEKITVQELLHVRSDQDLRELGTSINHAKAKFDPDFSTTDTFKVGGVDAEKVIRVLKLILKLREFSEYKKAAAAELKAIKTQLGNLETPDETRARLKAKQDELEGVLTI